MALSSKQRYQKERTKLTRNRLGKEIATVLVGEDEETFPVHHDLIAASSDFFNKALNGRFAEKNDTVKLQKVNVTVFGRYLQWLCEGRIFIAENVDRVAVQDWDDILDLLILGNLLQDNQFFNAVTDHLIDLSTGSGVIQQLWHRKRTANCRLHIHSYNSWSTFGCSLATRSG